MIIDENKILEIQEKFLEDKERIEKYGNDVSLEAQLLKEELLKNTIYQIMSKYKKSKEILKIELLLKELNKDYEFLRKNMELSIKDFNLNRVIVPDVTNIIKQFEVLKSPVFQKEILKLATSLIETDIFSTNKNIDSKVSIIENKSSSQNLEVDTNKKEEEEVFLEKNIQNYIENPKIVKSLEKISEISKQSEEIQICTIREIRDSFKIELNSETIRDFQESSNIKDISLECDEFFGNENECLKNEERIKIIKEVGMILIMLIVCFSPLSETLSGRFVTAFLNLMTIKDKIEIKEKKE